MKNKTSRKGRPPMADEEKAVVVAVSLPRELAAFALELGEGSASKGVQQALIAAVSLGVKSVKARVKENANGK
jgi:hypothetical protein